MDPDDSDAWLSKATNIDPWLMEMIREADSEYERLMIMRRELILPEVVSLDKFGELVISFS